jgi:hypothetical protein
MLFKGCGQLKLIISEHKQVKPLPHWGYEEARRLPLHQRIKRRLKIKRASA